MLTSSTLAWQGPSRLVSRQGTPCFITGGQTLPAEVADGLAALTSVSCTRQGEISPGIPILVSGGLSLADIDFQESNESPLGFAEKAFAIPDRPSSISASAQGTVQTQLNLYLAWEAALRSQMGTSSTLLGKVKSVKFFLQFQQARINQAKSVPLGPADTVEHQQGKVLKNAVGASQAEKDAVIVLAGQVS